MAKAKQDPRDTLTPVGVVSYPHLFKPQEGFNEGDKAKFGSVLVFPEGTDLTALKEAARAALEEKWGKKIPKKLNSPFRDAEDASEKAGYPENSVFINAKRREDFGPPLVIERYTDPATGKPAIITDPNAVYAGCEAIFHVSAYAYDVAGNKGVAFALNGVQKVADGDPIGRANPIDAFTAEEPVVADLDDVGEGEDEDEADGDMDAFM